MGHTGDEEERVAGQRDELGGGCGLLQRIEQFVRDLQLAASDADFDIRFGDAMKIASAGHLQVTLLGQVEIFGRLAWCMGAVVDFDASQPDSLEVANQRA